MKFEKAFSLLLSPVKRLMIQNKKGQLEPFVPNKVQRKVLKYIKRCWDLGQPARIIIIKGRQQGITTLFAMVNLALVLKIPGFRSYMMAHDKTLANDIFEYKVKFAFDNLPEAFKAQYETKRNNVRQLILDGDMKKASLAVGLSGRGGTYQSGHISEPGMMSTNKKLWKEMQTGTMEALEAADLVVMESTADGGLGAFYQLVKENMKPFSKFRVMFLSWTDSEEYQLEPPKSPIWKKEYEIISRDYRLHPDPQKAYGLTDKQFYWYIQKAKLLREEVKVQYPLNIEEAFVSLAKNYFNLRKLFEEEEAARNKKYQIIKGFKVWEQPGSDPYVVAADIATGEGTDNTSIQVFNARTGNQAAVFTGKIDEKEAARYMLWAGYTYNTALLCTEINSFGRAVVRYLTESDYPEYMIYKRIADDPTKQKENPLGAYGWYTTSVTRPIMLAEFRSALEGDGVASENKAITLNDIDSISEAKTFVNNNGKYEAQTDCNDDRIITAMIAWQAIQYYWKHC